jgi:hypothetical protein
MTWFIVSFSLEAMQCLNIRSGQLPSSTHEKHAELGADEAGAGVWRKWWSCFNRLIALARVKSHDPQAKLLSSRL